MATPDHQLPPEVLDALKQGNVIEAIKLLRESTGLGLAEAKSLIDARRNGNPEAKASLAVALTLPDVTEALRAGNKIEAVKRIRAHTGAGMKEAKDAIDALPAQPPGMTAGNLAPGEVPRSKPIGWWLAIAAALIALAIYFLR